MAPLGSPTVGQQIWPFNLVSIHYIWRLPQQMQEREKSLACLAGWMLFIKHNFFKNLQLSTANVGASGCYRRPSEGTSVLTTFPLSTGWWVDLSGTVFVLNLPHGPIYSKHMVETLLGDGLKFSRVCSHSLPFHCGSQSLHS